MSTPTTPTIATRTLTVQGGQRLAFAVTVPPAAAARAGVTRCGTLLVPVDAELAATLARELTPEALALLAPYVTSEGAGLGAFTPGGGVLPITVEGAVTDTALLAALRANGEAVRAAVQAARFAVAFAPYQGGRRYTVAVVQGREPVGPEAVDEGANIGAYTIRVRPNDFAAPVAAARELLSRLPIEAIEPAARDAARTVHGVDATAYDALAAEVQSVETLYGLGADAPRARLARFGVEVRYGEPALNECPALAALYERLRAAQHEERVARDAAAAEATARANAEREARNAEMREALRAYALTIPELAPGAEDGYEMGPGVADRIAARVESVADNTDGITTTRVMRQGDPGSSETDPPVARSNPEAHAVHARRSLAEACKVLALPLPPGIELYVSPVGRVHDADTGAKRTGFTVLVTGECPGVPDRLVVCFCE